jgi:hypothetical protein
MPEQVSPMESFAIYFPMVLREDAMMRLHWGTTAVPIRTQGAIQAFLNHVTRLIPIISFFASARGAKRHRRDPCHAPLLPSSE